MYVECQMATGHLPSGLTANVMGKHSYATCQSVRELVREQGVTVWCHPFSTASILTWRIKKDATAESTKWFQTYFMNLKEKPVIF